MIFCLSTKSTRREDLTKKRPLQIALEVKSTLVVTPRAEFGTIAIVARILAASTAVNPLNRLMSQGRCQRLPERIAQPQQKKQGAPRAKRRRAATKCRIRHLSDDTTLMMMHHSRGTPPIKRTLLLLLCPPVGMISLCNPPRFRLH